MTRFKDHKIVHSPIESWTVWNPTPVKDPDVTRSWVDRLDYSENNPDWLNLTRKSQPVGGRFQVKRHIYEEYNSIGDEPYLMYENRQPYPRYYARVYHSAFRSTVTDAHFPTLGYTPDATLAAWGRAQIAATAPTGEAYDLANLLGELREGIPKASSLLQTFRSESFKKSAGRETVKSLSKAGASDYLAYQFAVRPLAGEVKDFARTVSSAGRLWDQYMRDSGRLIKRRRAEPVVHTTNVVDMGNPYPLPYLNNYYYQPGAKSRMRLQRVERTSTRRWFVAAYKYWLPANPLGRYVSQANHVLGTTLDVGDLYALTPWSWMLNWFTDANVLAKNIDLFTTDHLVMPWCYVMEHKTSEIEYVWSGRDIYNCLPKKDVTFRQVFRTETKHRIPASPYGFSLNWDGFSPSQLAILGALGITRGG